MIDAASLSPWVWVVAPFVILAGFVMFGLAGFGSTIIAAPLLAHFLPVSFIVPLLAALDLAVSAIIGRRDKEKVATAELKRIVPLMLLGIFLGVTLLVSLPAEGLRAAVGVFATAVGIHGVANPVLRRTISAWWSVPAGLAGGAVASLVGAGGPIYATYFSGRLHDKGEIRATIATIIAISAFSRTLVYAFSGLLLHVPMLAAFLGLLPIALLGMKLGNRIHVGLTQVQMRRGVGFVLIASGLGLLARVFL